MAVPIPPLSPHLSASGHTPEELPAASTQTEGAPHRAAGHRGSGRIGDTNPPLPSRSSLRPARHNSTPRRLLGGRTQTNAGIYNRVAGNITAATMARGNPGASAPHRAALDRGRYTITTSARQPRASAVRSISPVV